MVSILLTDSFLCRPRHMFSNDRCRCNKVKNSLVRHPHIVGKDSSAYLQSVQHQLYTVVVHTAQESILHCDCYHPVLHCFEIWQLL